MSYILDALKKSQQERQGDGGPDLHVVHGNPSIERRARVSGEKLLLLCLVAVAVSAGVLYYFLAPEESLPAKTDPSGKIIVREIEIRPQLVDQKEDGGAVIADSPFIGGGTYLLSEEASQMQPIVKEKAKPLLVESAEEPEASPSRNFAHIKYRNELPAHIQKNLPQLMFAGHTYADDPRQRMIIVNNTILREGARIDDDTRLVNIIWEGVVLEYKGVFFKEKTH